MAYHESMYFLVFLPVVLIGYQLAPKQVRFGVLLFFSYCFYFLFSHRLIVYLLGATTITYLTGRLVATGEKKRRKTILIVGVWLLLGMLLVMKYSGFFAENLNALFGTMNFGFRFPVRRFLLPLGISFYTLSAIGYMADVYWKKIEPEKNIAKLALFLSFFPQIMEGPISRFSETADALYGGNSIQFENLVFGYQRIIWGLFKKMVIADRLAPLVSKVFSSYNNFDGAAILVGVLAYTMQLYMEFSGCMDIIMGSGEIFGVPLPENFRQPFFAKNAGDFWRRWHITLGAWLKDYVFYPISLAKPVKNLAKKIKKKAGFSVSKFVAPTIALFFVWLSNGIWHGPHMNYIFYGMYYFMLIVIENLTEEPCRKLVERFKLDTECIGFRIFQFLKLFVIVNIGEMFFRADTVATGFRMLRGIVTDFHITALAETNFGVDVPDLILAVVSILLVFVVDIIHEKGISIRRKVADCKLPVRWSFWYAVVLLVVVFGAYGSGYTIVDMIYAAY